jgi:CubicO group peptidase (beta-lactamase class C family)
MKRMSWMCGVALLTLIASAAAPAASGPFEHKTIPGASPEPIAERAGLRGKEDLEAFVDGLMAAHLKYNPMAGATISIVQGDQVLLVKGYGYADLEKQAKVDGEQSLFRPGSTSKLFTWTAVMQLVEQGKLDLDADVNQYIPNFKLPEAFGKPITLRNLMTHTAGLEDGGLGYLFQKGPEQFLPLGDALAAHMPTRVRPPTTEFGSDGTNASYSNWGTALAGHIVASVSGMSFEDYVKKHIFDPLGMSSSTFAEPLPPELAPRMATGYQFKEGKLKPHAFEHVHNFAPAGSLTSSAPDMARFMLAHLNGGAVGDARILKPETVELMHSRQFSPNAYGNGSGLGFYETWVNGRRLIGHGGDMIAFHTDFWLLEEEKIGVFVSYNSSNEVAPYVARRDLLRGFMDRYYPAQLPVLKAPDDFKARAAKYAGTYDGNRASYTKFERVFGLASAGTRVAPTEDNKLMIQDILFPGISYWIEVAPNVFRHESEDQFITFVEDEGRITHLAGPFTFIGSYKLPAYGAPTFHWLVLGFGLLCFVVALVSALRNWKADKAGQSGPRRARRSAALLALVYVGFFGTLIGALAGGIDELLYALPKSVYVALTFPLLAIPVTLAVVWFAVQAWRGSWWTRYARVQYSVIALTSLAFLWSLNYWNLVGYKSG